MGKILMDKTILNSAVYTINMPAVDFDTGVFLKGAGCFRLSEDQREPVTVQAGGDFLLLAVTVGKAVISYNSERIELNSSYGLLICGQDPVIISLDVGTTHCEGVFAVFGGESAAGIIEQWRQKASAPFFLRPDSPVLRNLTGIVADIQNDLVADAYEGGNLVFMLLCDLCRRFEQNQTERHPVLVEHAMALMRERFAYLYGIEEIAESMEVSKHHLIREFTRHTGISPGKYLSRIRIDNAKLLLKIPDYSIEIVGQLVGFSNGNYFCKAFRKITGESPRAYRSRIFRISAGEEKIDT